MNLPVHARLFVYVGHGNPTGDIQIYDFDPTPDSDGLALRTTVATGSSTSYLAFHPTRPFAYTTQNRSNRLSAFAIDPAGGLRPLGDVAVPAADPAGDAGPAYVTVDPRGRLLLAANYRGHNVVAYRLGDDGRIGALVANVSAGKHAHCVRLDPEGAIAFAPHLGADVVAQYRVGRDGDQDGTLTPFDPPAATTAPGAGPRHLTLSPDGRRAFLLNELDASLYGYDLDPRRGLVERWRVATLPADYDGRRWAADLHVHPDGRTLYVSNRAHDSLTVFALDPNGGPPATVDRVPCGGKTPRNFTLDPAGRFLLCANQDSNTLTTFAIDRDTGKLRQIGERPVGAAPYFVEVLPLPTSA